MILRSLLVVVAMVGLVGCSGLENPTQPSKNPPVISVFAADTGRITISQTTNLRWEVLDKDARVRIDPYPGNVGNIGSAAVVPTVVGPINFTLTATNEHGSSQRIVTVTVN
jgi:hypothetical protein